MSEDQLWVKVGDCVTILKEEFGMTKYPNQIYDLVNAGVINVMEGRPVLVNPGEVYEAFRLGKKAILVDDVEALPTTLTPFTKNPMVVMWNKGTYRGWATAYVARVDTDNLEYMGKNKPDTKFVEMVDQYASQHSASETRLISEFAQGKSFFVEPGDVVAMLIAQLVLHKEEAPKEAIKALEEAAKLLNEWKEARTEH